MVSMVMATSCTKDSEDPMLDETPTITLQVGADYVYKNDTFMVNTPIKIGIRAMANSSTGAKLVDFTFTRTLSGNTHTLDSVFSSATFSVDLLTSTNAQAGVETYIFTVKDKNGKMKAVTLLITTMPGSGAINTFSMKLLGAQANANGSSFASVDGTVYKLADAKANANKVDWLYYYGASDFATIAAPNDAHAAEVYNNATNGLQTWAKLNATKFKLITDAIDFNAITNDLTLLAQTLTGVDQTRIPNLKAGDLLAFITDSGKSGILKVESITGTSDGTLTISVKVQK